MLAPVLLSRPTTRLTVLVPALCLVAQLMSGAADAGMPLATSAGSTSAGSTPASSSTSAAASGSSQAPDPSPSSGPVTSAASAASVVPGRYVVVMRSVPPGGEISSAFGTELAGGAADASLPSRADAQRAISRLVTQLRIQPTQAYRFALDGFAAGLSDAQVSALRADPAVAAVVPDERTQVVDSVDGSPQSGVVRTTRLPHQVIPTGIRRVNANRSPLSRIDGVDQRSDVDVAIIDTGIAPHPDLNIAGGHDCTSGDPSAWRDRYGHGTHVAGIVGALDNHIGVVGVAPGARVWAVKVFNDEGLGYLSTYVCGIDWMMSLRDPSDASRPRIEVANMSFANWLPFQDDRDCGRQNGDVLHQAICAAVADGTTMVTSAGNDSANAALRKPSAFNEVITVSALADFDGKPGGKGRQASICPWYSPDQDDTFGDFSNWGPDVDIIAPGKCILSTYKNGLYSWETGTSMSSPTVAGAAALVYAAHPGVRPGQVRQALLAATNFDYFTRTDPDGHPDPLLDVSKLGPLPGFNVTVDPSADGLGPGGQVTMDVHLARVNGETAPLALTVTGLPDNVDASIAPERTTGSDATLTLTATGPLTAGTDTIAVHASDGDVSDKGTVEVTLVHGGSRVTFSSPAATDTTVTGSPSATVAFTENDPGDAPARRQVRRQRADPVTPGSCDGVDWQNDGPLQDVAERDPSGSVADGWSFAEKNLNPDGCYRWFVRLTAADASSERWSSGSVLVDTTVPPPPDLAGTGTGVWQGRPNGTIWIRGGGSGTLHLTAQGTDPSSGVAAEQFGTLSAASGWAYHPGSVSKDPATVSLRWSQGAVGTSLRVTSTDSVGNVGGARTVSIRVDSSRPSPPRWVWPAPGRTTIAQDTPSLLWSGASDSGSGPARLQLVQRQRGTVRRAGSCAGVAYRSDGPPRLLDRHHEERDVVTNSCYRWILTPLDQVGNRGRAVMSGTVLVDLTPPAATFTNPRGGGVHVTAATSITLRWTERQSGGSGGAVTRSLERERGKIVKPGTCTGVFWRPDGKADTGPSPSPQTGLKPGYCYRWRLNLGDRALNVGVYLSARLLIKGGAAATAASVLGAAPDGRPLASTGYRGATHRAKRRRVGAGRRPRDASTAA